MKFCKLLLFFAGLSLASGVYATDAEHIHASLAWIRVLPGALPAGAYVTLKNDSAQPITLRVASSTNYAEVMLHHSSTAGGVSRMSMLDSLDVPADGQVSLAPGGYHLMLMQPKQTVAPGDSVTLILTFADGSTLATKFIARPANAMDDTGDDHAEHATPGVNEAATSHRR